METHDTGWRPWPVSWSGIWIGALAALAVGLVIGLTGYAVGAHEHAQFVDWKKIRLTGLMFSVGGAFGGWMASGEPMSITYYRRRDRDVHARSATPTAVPPVAA